MALNYTPRAQAGATVVTAQQRLWQALGRATVNPLPVVFNGDSNTWGHYPYSDATHSTLRWSAMLGRKITSRWNNAGIGGQCYMAMDMGWTLSGVYDSRVDRGLGFQSRVLNAGDTMSRIIPDADAFTIIYEGGTGQFTVTIDGGAATTVTPTAQAQDHGNSNKWVSPVSASRGPKNILITALSGGAIITGVYAHAGDLTQGVQVWTAGRNGVVSSDGTLESNFARIKAMQPKVLFYQILSNNFALQISLSQYMSEVSNYIERVLYDCPNAVIVLFNSHYRKTSAQYTIKQQAYWGKMKELAAQRPQNVMAVNTSDIFPQFANEYSASETSFLDPYSVINGDGVHMNVPQGAAIVAEAVFTEVFSPRITGSSKPVPELTLPSPVLEFDAAKLALADGAAVSSWPSTGADTSPLVVGSGTAPTMKTGSIPYVTFDGTSQSLAGSFGALDSGTIILVHSGTAGSTSQQSLISGLAGQSNFWQMDAISSGLQLSYGWSTVNQFSGSTGYGALGQWNITAINFQKDNLWLALNKVLKQTRRNTLASGGSVSGLTLGANLARSGQFLNGRIGYLGVFAPLSTVNAAEVLKAVSKRFSIGLSGNTTTEVP